MPRPTKPRPPTKRQREIGERFKRGESPVEIADSLALDFAKRTTWLDVDAYVERAIRICLVWGRRNG